MLPRFHDSSFIYDICILHFGIMLPRFHVPSFIYGVPHSGIMLPRFSVPFFFFTVCVFWNYVASIP